MTYDFSLDISTANYEIKIDIEKDYGYFEHNTHGEEIAGGLWFEDNLLIDYDGVFELPEEVEDSLKAFGIIIEVLEE